MLGLPPSLPPPPLSRSVPLLSLEGLEPGACALEARDTLDMAHPFSIISGHAEQDRTHAYTHTHRDTHTKQATTPNLPHHLHLLSQFFIDGVGLSPKVSSNRLHLWS